MWMVRAIDRLPTCGRKPKVCFAIMIPLTACKMSSTNSRASIAVITVR